MMFLILRKEEQQRIVEVVACVEAAHSLAMAHEFSWSKIIMDRYSNYKLASVLFQWNSNKRISKVVFLFALCCHEAFASLKIQKLLNHAAYANGF